MINREKCEDLIINTVNNNIHRRAFANILKRVMKRDHDLMEGRTLQLVNNKDTLSAASVEELYWLCNGIEEALDNEVSFEEFFTPSEAGMYRNSRARRENKDVYPIVFNNVLQISNDQWVTTINIDQLCELNNNQLVNYNKNTQRPTIRRERNGLVEYKISVNQHSIREITDLMKEHLFIPNALTFNINMDNPDNDFEYSNGRLRLNSGAFDIIDGFHRYRSLINCKQEDSSFNYNMILNIVNFTEEKAGTYIAQEDKRNKISTSVVKTMDANNPINRVISRLNDDGRSLLRGQIGRTGNVPVDASWLYEVISKCYMINDKAGEIDLVKWLREVFNAVIEDGLLEKNFFNTAAIVIASKMYKENGDIAAVERIVKASKYLPDDLKKQKTVTKSFIAEVEKLQSWS